MACGTSTDSSFARRTFDAPLLADMVLLRREPESVLLAGSDRTVSVRLLHSLEPLHRFCTTSPIRCLALDAEERFLLQASRTASWRSASRARLLHRSRLSLATIRAPMGEQTDLCFAVYIVK